MIDFNFIINHDIGLYILRKLIYPDNIINIQCIYYLKNLCLAMPSLFKNIDYKKNIIDVANETLITRRYYIGMTQKMKVISYNIEDQQYYDYVNVIFDNNIYYYDDIKYCQFQSYIKDYMELPPQVENILEDILIEIMFEHNSYLMNHDDGIVIVDKTLQNTRWVDCKEYIMSGCSKSDRLHLFTRLDTLIRNSISDLISIEKSKQEIIKHLYPK